MARTKGSAGVSRKEHNHDNDRMDATQRLGRALVAVALGSSMFAAFPASAIAEEELVAGKVDSGQEATEDGVFSDEVGDRTAADGDESEWLVDTSSVTYAKVLVEPGEDGEEAVPENEDAVQTPLASWGEDGPGNSSSKPGASAGSGSSSGSNVPLSFLPNPSTEEFIASIAEPAREIGQKNGLYASVMIAQAVLESGSGSSGLSKPPYNNLFGIKGSYRGESVALMTSEDDGTGNEYNIVAGFRKYPSVAESLQDYADLLTKSMGSFYAPAWKANARTYVEACDYLQGHYATDTSYSGKLQGIILAYDLEQYDHPVGWADTEEGQKARAESTLKKLLPNTNVSLEPTKDPVVPAVAEPQASSSADAAIPEAVSAPEASDDTGAQEEWRRKFEVPLEDPGVRVSLVSLGALVALFAKNEIAVIAHAALKLGAHLPFFLK